MSIVTRTGQATAGSGAEVPHIGALNVTKRYGAIVALAGVDVDLAAGVTVLLGRNGAGKSTLCRIISGAETPDSGELLRNGEPLAGQHDLHLHRAGTGWMPQAVRATGTMTVRQYLAYAAWLKGSSGTGLEERLERALKACRLEDLQHRRLGQLSGGMLRRAGLAQAIVDRPAFLVLDEPTVGLDPEQRGEFHRLISELAQERIVLMSTHLLEDALAIGRQIVVLDQGLVRFEGTLDQMLERGAGDDGPSRMRSAFLSIVNGSPSS